MSQFMEISINILIWNIPFKWFYNFPLYDMNDIDLTQYVQVMNKKWRKKKERQINFTPLLTVREPTDGTKDATNVYLGHDELEAMRLKYQNGLGIIPAAQQMGISKSLFANILNNGLKKVTNALIHGRALHIELGRPEYQKETSIGFRKTT